MRALIVAKAKNDVIGRNNDLPWYLPADLKHFKELTTGHTVIMGRKTYESIFNRLNGPLPNRRNIVVSRSTSEFPVGFEGASSLNEAFDMASNESDVYVIGGSSLYKEALEEGLIDKMFITLVHEDIEGDVYFPELDYGQWQETDRVIHHADEKNKYDYDFVTFKRKR